MEKILFDAHSHLNYNGYTEDERAIAISVIEESAVCGVIDVGYDLSSSVRAVSHAGKYPWCFAAAGMLPVDGAAEYINDRDAALNKLVELSKMPGMVAIGEIGLEYVKGETDDKEKARQAEQFRAQIAVARELDLPVVIHDRDSHGDVMRILKEERAFDGAGVMLHCYSGHTEQALEYSSLGAMISLAGQLTWSNARKSVEVAANVPDANLLIETDAPFLTPEPHRGKKNVSPYIEFTARRLAEIRGMEYEKVAEVTRENTMRFFGVSL